jgi:hypothetical protein
VPLCDGEGRAVLLEDLEERPGVRELARVVSRNPAGRLASPDPAPRP